MATRRNVTTGLEKNEKDFAKPAVGEKSNIAPAVPAWVSSKARCLSSHMRGTNDGNRHVIYKLLGFTLAMVVGPIGSYFLTVDTIFGGVFLLVARKDQSD
jgi:vacuolar ATPase assembly integral membrane protein VMA21